MAYIHDGPPLYVTADKSEVVQEDDPRAAFLLVATGGTLGEEEAKKYGLLGKGGRVEPPEEKAKAEPPNKARPAPPNKAKG